MKTLFTFVLIIIFSYFKLSLQVAVEPKDAKTISAAEFSLYAVLVNKSLVYPLQTHPKDVIEFTLSCSPPPGKENLWYVVIIVLFDKISIKIWILLFL